MAPEKNSSTEVALERVAVKIDLFMERVDKHMDNVDTKLDKLDTRVDAIDVTLGKQHVSLDEHVRRTNLLEMKLEKETKAIKDELTPIKATNEKFKLIAKVAGILLGAGAAGSGVGVLLKKIIDVIMS